MACISYKTRNVIHVGIACICVFFAFNSQGFIEQTVITAAANDGNISPMAGYYSLAIIYAFSMLTNLVVAPAVDILGPRWSMTLGSLMFTTFLIGFLFLNETYLYVSSALLGIGSAFLWIGQGKYLTLNSDKDTAGRNSGVFWGMLQSSLLSGGVFLLGIFSTIDTTVIDRKLRIILYGAFTGVCLLGNIIFAMLPMRGLIEEKRKEEKPSQLQILSQAFRLLFTKNMLLLTFSFVYTGLELSYWSGVYSTAISFTKKLEYDTRKLIAWNAIVQGIGQIVGGFCFGIMGEKFNKYGRNPIMLIGYIVHIICFALSFVNFPAQATVGITDDNAIIKPSIALAMFVGLILGFGDACWNTQIYSILVDVYSDQSAQAFSILKFAQAAAACAAFFYTASMTLPYVLLILVITGTLGIITFVYVERRTRAERAKEIALKPISPTEAMLEKGIEQA